MMGCASLPGSDLGFAILVCLGAVTYWALRTPGRHRLAGLRWFWLVYAACQTALAGFAFYSHFRFPLNLEFMESTGLQHDQAGRSVEFPACGANTGVVLVQLPALRLVHGVRTSEAGAVAVAPRVLWRAVPGMRKLQSQV